MRAGPPSTINSECRGIGASSSGRGVFSTRELSLLKKTPKQSRIGHTVSTRVIRDAEPQPRVDYEDPEKTYGMRRIGGRKSHTISTRNTPMAWLQNMPSIWTRNTLESRKHDELLELVVLNERLAGRESWEARRRLEYLKKRRSNWEAIYNYITTSDAAATLELVEEANHRVSEKICIWGSQTHSCMRQGKRGEKMERDLLQLCSYRRGKGAQLCAKACMHTAEQPHGTPHLVHIGMHKQP
ncbi:hypothetical protein DUNSADRAFT_13130 [Dunaliella salina]|uniref:Uncharacterized protein n=1 Tax=Dunaliella salina TaxID=3046 RepID=A0ABQ7GA20_DUNSA|nr:hypothetical protein DUNSADRAFT_13130 [Dunaliella salina]|eukprot:KAF5831455.1 hypothetical protein DUNSADRAFT_13130 [Dunaliella salina]